MLVRVEVLVIVDELALVKVLVDVVVTNVLVHMRELVKEDSI